jgi:hypothetical protein
MKRAFCNRRDFLKKTGMIVSSGMVLPRLFIGHTFGAAYIDSARDILLSTDFVSGGVGSIELSGYDPLTIQFKPHNEGEGGWAQVWWYFSVEGIQPGEKIILELDRGIPASAGISPQVFFSYDQEVWGLTNTGVRALYHSREFFVYQHVVKSNKVWFAYDLPYTPDLLESFLLPKAFRNSDVKVFELCKSKNGRSVRALKFDQYQSGDKKRFGIWLQARAHAFESGTSWVLHELAEWLMAGSPDAKSLLESAQIVIIPIFDIDGVVEGRTGKNQQPYDHNRGWSEEPNHWPETNAARALMKEMANDGMFDMYIDFHGPGNMHHPYFIVPDEDTLPYEKQRQNRKTFFDILQADPLTEEATFSQSMTQFFVSERSWDQSVSSSREWVIMHTNNHAISLTIEINMNTPLSTRSGYKAEAIALGRAMSRYFSEGHHQK